MNENYVNVKKEKLVAKVLSEKNDLLILEGFTEKINYVFNKSDCENINNSLLKTNVSDIGYDSFFKKLTTDYNKIKNNIFSKQQYKLKDNKLSKSLLEKINIFLAYKSCYEIIDETEFKKIMNICFGSEEIQQIPYIYVNNKIKGISCIHVYKYVIQKIFKINNIPNPKIKLVNEYYNKTIKEYYNFFRSNLV